MSGDRVNFGGYQQEEVSEEEQYLQGNSLGSNAHQQRQQFVYQNENVLPQANVALEYSVSMQLDLAQHLTTINRTIFNPYALEETVEHLTILKGFWSRLPELSIDTAIKFRAIYCQLQAVRDTMIVLQNNVNSNPTKAQAQEPFDIFSMPNIPSPTQHTRAKTFIPSSSPLINSPTPARQTQPPLIDLSDSNASVTRFKRFTKEDEVPTFDGKASNWPVFKTLFNETVIENNFNSDVRAKDLLGKVVPEQFQEIVRSSHSCSAALEALSDRFEQKSEIESELYRLITTVSSLRDKPSVDEWKKYRDAILNIHRRATPFGEVMLSQMHTSLSYGKLGPFYTPYMRQKAHRSLDDLLRFTNERITMLEDMAKHRAQSIIVKPVLVTSKPQPYATTAATTTWPTSVESCAFCHLSHLRRDCPMSRTERRDALKRQGKCFGCYKKLKELPGHIGHCQVMCRFCKRKGVDTHVCSCIDRNQNASSNRSFSPKPPSSGPGNASGNQEQQEAVVDSPEPEESSYCSAVIEEPPEEAIACGITTKVVYLPTLKVFAKKNDNVPAISARVLLDQASSASYISEALVSQLGLTKYQIQPVTVRAFGGMCHLQLQFECRVKLQSALRSNISAEVVLYVMPGTLIGKIPAPSEELRQIANQHHIQLSDASNNNEVGEINILIGQDLYNDHFLLPVQRRIKPKPGVAFVPTTFGWVLQGAPGGRSLPNNLYTNCSYMSIGHPTESTSTLETESSREPSSGAGWVLESDDVVSDASTLPKIKLTRRSRLSYKKLLWFSRRMSRYTSRYVDIKSRYPCTSGKIPATVLEEELKCISLGKPVPESSPLKNEKLSIDSQGLLRTHRRLDHSDLSYESKDLLALQDHPVPRDFIKFTNQSQARHSGAPTTEHHILQFGYIPNANRIIRSVVADRFTCRRYQTGKPFVAQTAPLPADRVNPLRSIPKPAHLISGRPPELPLQLRTRAIQKLIPLEPDLAGEDVAVPSSQPTSFTSPLVPPVAISTGPGASAPTCAPRASRESPDAIKDVCSNVLVSSSS